MGLILLIVVLVLLFGGGAWGYRTGYVGYNPLGLILLIVVVLVLVSFFTPLVGHRYW